MEASHLTNKIIHDSAVYDSIAFYLQPGETREAFMKQFGNNLDKTIQFLRERSYEGLEKQKSAPVAQVRKVIKEPEDNIMHPKHDVIYDAPPRSASHKKKPKETKSSQKGLF